MRGSLGLEAVWGVPFPPRLVSCLLGQGPQLEEGRVFVESLPRARHHFRHCPLGLHCPVIGGVRVYEMTEVRM